MFQAVTRFIRFVRALRHILIEDDTPLQLVIRSGMSITTFQKSSGRVLQGSRFIASFEQIVRIQVGELEDSNESMSWTVRIGMRGRELVVGRSFDQLEASIAAARIGSIVDRPVEIVGSFAPQPPFQRTASPPLE